MAKFKVTVTDFQGTTATGHFNKPSRNDVMDEVYFKDGPDDVLVLVDEATPNITFTALKSNIKSAVIEELRY